MCLTYMLVKPSPRSRYIPPNEHIRIPQISFCCFIIPLASLFQATTHLLSVRVDVTVDKFASSSSSKRNLTVRAVFWWGS